MEGKQNPTSRKPGLISFIVFYSLLLSISYCPEKLSSKIYSHNPGEMLKRKEGLFYESLDRNINKRMGTVSHRSIQETSSGDWDTYRYHKGCESAFFLLSIQFERAFFLGKEKDPEIPSQNVNFVGIISVSSLYFLLLIALHTHKGRKNHYRLQLPGSNDK